MRHGRWHRLAPLGLGAGLFLFSAPLPAATLEVLDSAVTATATAVFDQPGLPNNSQTRSATGKYNASAHATFGASQGFTSTEVKAGFRTNGESFRFRADAFDRYVSTSIARPVGLAVEEWDVDFRLSQPTTATLDIAENFNGLPTQSLALDTASGQRVFTYFNQDSNAPTLPLSLNLAAGGYQLSFSDDSLDRAGGFSAFDGQIQALDVQFNTGAPVANFTPVPETGQLPVLAGLGVIGAMAAAARRKRLSAAGAK